MTKGKHSSLAAMMLAGSLSVGAQAQGTEKTPAAASAGTLGTVVVSGKKDRLGVSGKASVRELAGRMAPAPTAKASTARRRVGRSLRRTGMRTLWRSAARGRQGYRAGKSRSL